jgi:hypothetical protein
MTELRVGVADLQIMSVRWQTQAATLGVSAPPTLGLSCQPSAQAVNAGHAAVAAAATSLRTRVHTGATKVAEADTRYVTNEANSSAKLATVAG